MSGGLRWSEENWRAWQGREAARSTRQAPLPKRTCAPSKYGNEPTAGYASKREATRAHELRLLAQSGQITDLQEQVRYQLIPKQVNERACHYIADFVYRNAAGELVVEDVKSGATKTPAYIIKRKLLLLVHNLRIVES